MWRLTLLSVPIFFVGLAPAVAQSTPDAADDDDVPVLRIHGDEADDDEEIAELTVDEEVDEDADEIDGIATPAPDPEFATGRVDWEFVPVIEVLHATGAVTEVDVQRTLQDDQQGIADCFEPTSYPGEGAVEVDVHVSYNGIPTSVNGTTDQVVRPNQARCVLRRAWRYDFPRVAADADRASHLGYRVSFVGQRVDTPDVEPGQAQLLLERVRTADEQVQDGVAQSLTEHLDTARECAAEGLDELPTDFVANQVHARWQHTTDGHYRPTDVDITVTNKTSSEMPSPDLVDCYERTLSRWDVQLDADEVDELPSTVKGSYYVTVRPAGWYGM